MGRMDYEHERSELERKFQKFARENPDHPAVIRAIASRIVTRKHEEPTECERDWLDLALQNPNHPRVLRVRRLVGHLKDRGVLLSEPAGTDGDTQTREEKIDPSLPNPESDRPYGKFSAEERADIIRDTAEHLRITRILEEYAKLKSPKRPN